MGRTNIVGEIPKVPLYPERNLLSFQSTLGTPASCAYIPRPKGLTTGVDMLRHKVIVLAAVLALLGAPLVAQSVVGSGAEIKVRTDQAIQANARAVGKTYPVTVTDDIKDQNGNVAIPKGSPAQVAVTKGPSANEVTLALSSLTVNGHRYLLATNKTTRKGGKEGIGMNKRTGEYVGGGALAGTLIGAIAGGGKGAAIGALLGGAAGAVCALDGGGGGTSADSRSAGEDSTRDGASIPAQPGPAGCPGGSFVEDAPHSSRG